MRPHILQAITVHLTQHTQYTNRVFYLVFKARIRPFLLENPLLHSDGQAEVECLLLAVGTCVCILTVLPRKKSVSPTKGQTEEKERGREGGKSGKPKQRRKEEEDSKTNFQGQTDRISYRKEERMWN